MATQCNLINPLSSDAMYIRALCVYSSDLEKGMEYLKRAIVLDPDHTKSKALALKLKRFKEKEKAGIEII